MPKASDLKKGEVIELNGQLLQVREIEVHSPSARGAATLYKVRFSNVRTQLKHMETFKGDDMLTSVSLQRRPVTFSYVDGDDYIFMDTEDFTQFMFKKDDLEDDLLFITENMQGLQILMADGEQIGLDLPQSVDMKIIETAPGLKGASAKTRTKPASFSTGLTVQVPEYLEEGENVKIHIAEKRYMGRAE